MTEELWYNAEHNLGGVLVGTFNDFAHWDSMWNFFVTLPFSDVEVRIPSFYSFHSKRKPVEILQYHGWEFIGEV